MENIQLKGAEIKEELMHIANALPTQSLTPTQYEIFSRILVQLNKLCEYADYLYLTK